MAGSYTRKEFGAGSEEQTLLKDSNGTRIVKGTEPVRLSPGWEGTGRPEDELNFKSVTVGQAERNPPKDRWNLVFFVLLLHGIGVLMPWNMFINANQYFVDHKLHQNYTHVNSTYGKNFLPTLTFAAQIPGFLFNWLNIFIDLGGNLTIRIAWAIFVEVLMFVLTVVLAMVNTSHWPAVFFWITMIFVVIMNTANGIYQSSVFGIAAKLPSKYTGVVILGSNLSGTFTSLVDLLARYAAPDVKTAAIYYFITALFVLLACFDTYFALPLNRFFRYHDMLYQRETNKKQLENRSKGASEKPPYWKIFKQCFPQCFNIFFVFFVTLSIFPSVQSQIKESNPHLLFFDGKDYFINIMCFLTFNVTALIGSTVASAFQWPSKKYIVFPVVLRALYIPLFLLCNYHPDKVLRQLPVLINHDGIYFLLAVTMGLSSGYFSSVAMMYCPRMVESQNASTAGMFGAASLASGIFCGILFSMLMPWFISISW